MIVCFGCAFTSDVASVDPCEEVETLQTEIEDLRARRNEISLSPTQGAGQTEKRYLLERIDDLSEKRDLARDRCEKLDRTLPPGSH